MVKAMMKVIRIAAVLSAISALCSCTNIRDDMGLSYEMAMKNPTEAYKAATEAEYAGFIETSDYADYFDDFNVSATEPFSIDDIISDKVDSDSVSDDEADEPTEKITENPTEAETQEQTEAPQTTKKKSDKKKSDYKAADCIEVPYISQEKYPTGCELVSATMLLSYYGFEVEPLHLIDEGYLKAVDVERKNGKLYGGDPNKVFVGNPSKNTGFGCYSPALKKALEKFLEDDFFDVYLLDDMSLPDICSQYIDLDEPVIIWATIDMKPTEKMENTTWIIDDSGTEFSWLSNEHCMVLVGYDSEYYYIHDPQRGAFTPYKKKDVEKRYDEIGRQAISLMAW